MGYYNNLSDVEVCEMDAAARKYNLVDRRFSRFPDMGDFFDTCSDLEASLLTWNAADDIFDLLRNKDGFEDIIVEGHVSYYDIALEILRMISFQGNVEEIAYLMEKAKWILDEKYINDPTIDDDGEDWDGKYFPEYNIGDPDEYIRIKLRWTLLEKLLEFSKEVNDLFDEKYSDYLAVNT